MADLTTEYMGLTLQNPVVVGSSGLTGSVNEIREMEKNGAGAIVLKSLFEEQIILDVNQRLRKAAKDSMIYDTHSETFDYIDLHVREKTLTSYLEQIQQLKNSIMIPVIASVNCITGQEWTSFAQKLEEAGADAIELNIFVMPFNFDAGCRKNEEIILDILKKVKEKVTIPVSVKISPYFSNLGNVIHQIAENGADGIVLFNRFAGPDIDIEKEKVSIANRFSTHADLTNTLRWIAVASSRINTPLAASTGIHHWEDIIKILLAGAQITQVTSAIYLNGPEVIQTFNENLYRWMENKGYNYIDQFRGKLSQDKSGDPEIYERLQFMKYYSEINDSSNK